MGGKLTAAFRGTPLELDMESAFRKIAESMEGKVTLGFVSRRPLFGGPCRG